MEQLTAALTELLKYQKEQQRRMEEHQKQQDEQVMQELHTQQMETVKEALKERAHLKIAPYQEKEDTQDFLEAFEGIMGIQKVPRSEWVLRLTPLLNGKARAVCTDFGPTTDYREVRKAILEHHNVNPERCRRQFRALSWTREQEPAEWVAKVMKLMKRWLLPDIGVNQIMDKIAVEQLINGLPQELRIWVASHDPETPAKLAQLMESYDSAHMHDRPAWGSREKPRNCYHTSKFGPSKEKRDGYQGFNKRKETTSRHCML